VLAERQADAAPLEAEYADDLPPLHRLLLSQQLVQERAQQVASVPELWLPA
jgi:hypothetical protein